MQISNSVKVGGAHYSVVMIKNLRKKTKGFAGTINYVKSIIKIGKDNNICFNENTLLHEIVHAIIFDRKLENRFKSEIDMEDFVDSFASGLHGVITDNPLIFED
jgi:Zn-dependent peptidase ImmA (M78 family)